VRDLPTVQVLQPCSQRADYEFGVLLAGSVALLLLQVGIERNAVQVFHDDVEVVVRLHYVQNLDYVGVVQQLQDADLAADGLLALGLPQFGLFVDLDGDLAVERLEHGHPYRRVGALSHHFPHDVVLLELRSEVD
jgi:hypothetical protein